MKRYLKYILILLLFFPSIIKAETISYEDAKKTVKEVIKAYYMRGDNIQYNLSRATYGTENPEEATFQDNKYLVCAAYTYTVYSKAFGIRYSDENKFPRYASTIYNTAKAYYNENSENPEELDGHFLLYYYFDGTENEEHVHKKYTYGALGDTLSVSEFAKLLQPGDMISTTHAAIIYDTVDRDGDGEIDDALILHSTRKSVKENNKTVTKSLINSIIAEGDNKISFDTFEPKIENYLIDMDIEGSIRSAWLSEYGLLHDTDAGEENLGCSSGKCAIIRIYNKDENNNAIFNYQTNYEQYQKAKIRTDYPSLYIEKTVDVGDNNSVYVGDTLTYTINIINKSNITNEPVIYNQPFTVEETIGDNVVLLSGDTELPEEKTISWNVDTINPGDSQKFTYTVKVKTLGTNDIVANGKFYMQNDSSIYLDTGVVSNPVLAKKIAVNNSYETCYNQYKENTTGLALIDAIYQCVNENSNLNLTNFSFDNFYTKKNARNEENTENGITIKDIENNVYFKMVLNKYWSGLIYKDNSAYFPRWRDYAVNRAKTIVGSDFQDGDILIYEMQSNSYTSEDGLYAYIYLGDKFVGNNYPGEANERLEFTHNYYEGKYRSLYNGCDDNICENISDPLKTFTNYQSLYGKDSYVILRPSAMMITFESNVYQIDNSKKVLSRIPRNSSITDIKNQITTNGIIDNDMEITSSLKTGDIIKTSFGIDEITMDYKASVIGDVTGTGDIHEDAKKIAKHIIDKNILTDDAYIVAADYNNDTSIKMNDVMKLLKDNS